MQLLHAGIAARCVQ